MESAEFDSLAAKVELAVSRLEALAASLLAKLGAERFAAARSAGRVLSYEQTMALAREVLDAAAGAAGPEPAAPPAGCARADPLSPREREVLGLIAEGLSNREIAARLVVAERTAKYHVTSLFNKLGVFSRAQAVAAAAQRGLLTTAG